MDANEIKNRRCFHRRQAAIQTLTEGFVSFRKPDILVNLIIIQSLVRFARKLLVRNAVVCDVDRGTLPQGHTGFKAKVFS